MVPKISHEIDYSSIINAIVHTIEAESCGFSQVLKSKECLFTGKKRIIARIPNMYIDIIICMQKKYDTKRDKDFFSVMKLMKIAHEFLVLL